MSGVIIVTGSAEVYPISSVWDQLAITEARLISHCLGNSSGAIEERGRSIGRDLVICGPGWRGEELTTFSHSDHTSFG